MGNKGGRIKKGEKWQTSEGHKGKESFLQHINKAQAKFNLNLYGVGSKVFLTSRAMNGEKLFDGKVYCIAFRIDGPNGNHTLRDGDISEVHSNLLLLLFIHLSQVSHVHSLL